MRRTTMKKLLTLMFVSLVVFSLTAPTFAKTIKTRSNKNTTSTKKTHQIPPKRTEPGGGPRS